MSYPREKREYTCGTCQKHYGSAQALKQHVSLLHTGEDLYTCDQFPSKSHLDRHTSIHTGDLTYDCYVCKKQYRNNTSLQSHILSHFKEKKKEWCNICNKEFKHLKLHMGTHSTDIHTCEICKTPFKGVSSFKSHMRRIHLQEKMYKCEFCSQAYRQASQLSYHMTIHLEKSFTCDLCNRRLATFASLRRHIQVHVGWKSIECEHCERTFLTDRLLKSHLLTHSGLKEFSCEICLMKFSKKQQRDQHMTKHTGDKPFRCKTCRQRFRLKQSLKRHRLQMHTGQKSHLCTICDECFLGGDQLRKHTQTHLGNQETNATDSKEIIMPLELYKV